MKRLDQKLSNRLNGSTSAKDFIIADAKDADMAFGITAPGPQTGSCRHGYNESEGCWKTLAQYREQIRAVIEQDIFDIMLLSASNAEKLGIQEGLFKYSAITSAARANDTSDVWAVRGGKYPTEHPSRSFRSATLDHIKYGHLTDNHSAAFTGADLGLYSITFTNHIGRRFRRLRSGPPRHARSGRLTRVRTTSDECIIGEISTANDDTNDNFFVNSNIGLGLYGNEANILCRLHDMPCSEPDTSAEVVLQQAFTMREQLGISRVVIHRIQFAVSASVEGGFTQQGPYSANPKKSTGARRPIQCRPLSRCCRKLQRGRIAGSRLCGFRLLRAQRPQRKPSGIKRIHGPMGGWLTRCH